LQRFARRVQFRLRLKDLMARRKLHKRFPSHGRGGHIRKRLNDFIKFEYSEYFHSFHRSKFFCAHYITAANRYTV